MHNGKILGLSDSENKYFDSKNINLEPKMAKVTSRSECDTSTKLGEHTFDMPVMASNMAAVVDVHLAKYLAKRKIFYAMHRFNIDPVEFTKEMHDNGLISSISLGVKEADYKHVNQFAEQNIIPEYITVDIAHGHAESVKKIIQHIQEKLGNKVFIIAGNVGTPQAVKDLEEWGADATKVGIGPGSACTTYNETGFGTRDIQLSIVRKCAKIAQKPIIADGGIKLNGDFAKAVSAGANMVMVGGILSGHTENPGSKIKQGGVFYKEFYGSASAQNKTNTNGAKVERIEGRSISVPYKGPIDQTLKKIKESLQSAISYSGGKELKDLRNVNWIYKH